MLANVFLDNGNGNEKAKSDTKEVIYPNRLKIYDENPLHKNLLSNSNKRETVYEVNGKKYVVDQNGMGSGSPVWVVVHVMKIAMKQTFIMLRL